MNFSYTVGMPLYPERTFIEDYIDTVAKAKCKINDLHFAHFDPSVIASGRMHERSDSLVVDRIIRKLDEHKITGTLLMNYLINDDFKSAISAFKSYYYDNGIRNVVVGDLRLADELKSAFPDIHLQGSVLLYGETVEDLERERRHGIEIHNPHASIIRNPAMIKDMHEAGFKLKVMPFEGCFNHCPFEKADHGHRWAIARNKPFDNPNICSNTVLRDMRQFFLANWTVPGNLAELAPYIDVVKIPRGTDYARIAGGGGRSLVNEFTAGKMLAESAVGIMNMIDNDLPYNILDLIAVDHVRSLRKVYRAIPSQLFDKNFFDTVNACDQQCTNCNLCFRKTKELESFMKDKENYKIRGVSIVRRN